MKLTLSDAEAARRPFDLDVRVDRGLATYVHPLPAADAGAFTGDRYAGWGEAQNPASSPAYTEIAATRQPRLPSLRAAARWAGCAGATWSAAAAPPTAGSAWSCSTVAATGCT